MGPVVSGESNWARAIHTETSSTGEKTLTSEHITMTVAALLGMGFAVAAWAMKRSGRRLRMPTGDQLTEIGEPTGKLALRYTPLEKAPESLVDISQLAKGISHYVLEGPLTEPLQDIRHIGMPDDITEPDQDQISPDSVSYLS